MQHKDLIRNNKRIVLLFKGAGILQVEDGYGYKDEQQKKKKKNQK
jgi:hypothetical protein